MPITDCETGQTREYTAEEKAAIDAKWAAEPRLPPFQTPSESLADGLARFIDEMVASGALTSTRGTTLKTRLDAWKA